MQLTRRHLGLAVFCVGAAVCVYSTYAAPSSEQTGTSTLEQSYSPYALYAVLHSNRGQDDRLRIYRSSDRAAVATDIVTNKSTKSAGRKSMGHKSAVQRNRSLGKHSIRLVDVIVEPDPETSDAANGLCNTSTINCTWFDVNCATTTPDCTNSEFYCTGYGGCTSADNCTQAQCTGGECTSASVCTNLVCTSAEGCTAQGSCTTGTECTGGPGDACTGGTLCTIQENCTMADFCTTGLDCQQIPTYWFGNCTYETNCTMLYGDDCDPFTDSDTCHTDMGSQCDTTLACYTHNAQENCTNEDLCTLYPENCPPPAPTTTGDCPTVDFAECPTNGMECTETIFEGCTVNDSNPACQSTSTWLCPTDWGLCPTSAMIPCPIPTDIDCPQPTTDPLCTLIDCPTMDIFCPTQNIFCFTTLQNGCTFTPGCTAGGDCPLVQNTKRNGKQLFAAQTFVIRPVGDDPHFAPRSQSRSLMGLLAVACLPAIIVVGGRWNRFLRAKDNA